MADSLKEKESNNSANVKSGLPDESNNHKKKGGSGKRSTPKTSEAPSSNKGQKIVHNVNVVAQQKSSSPKASDNSSEILDLLKNMQHAQQQSQAQVEDLVNRMADIEAYASQPWEGDICEEKVDCDSGEEGEISETPISCDKEDKFSSLSKRFKSVEPCGDPVNEKLASHITDLFRQGMDEIQYEHMIKDENTPRPSNCEGLQAVRMNRPIWDVISRASQTMDNKLQRCANSVLKASVILTKTVDKMAKMDKDDVEVGSVIESVNDALALLGHSHHQNVMVRRDLIRPELRKEYNVLCNHSKPYTGFLFGDDVAKSVKDIEETSRMGFKVQNQPRRFFPGGFQRGGKARYQPYPVQPQASTSGFGFRGGFRSYRGRGNQFPGRAQFEGSKNFSRRGGVNVPRR